MSKFTKKLKDVQYTIGLIVVGITLLILAVIMASIELLINVPNFLKKGKLGGRYPIVFRIPATFNFY